MIGRLACLLAVFTVVPLAANAYEIRSATIDGARMEAAVVSTPSDPDTQQVLDSLSKALPVGAIYRAPQTPADLAGLKLPVEQCQTSAAQRC